MTNTLVNLIQARHSASPNRADLYLELSLEVTSRYKNNGRRLSELFGC